MAYHSKKRCLRAILAAALLLAAGAVQAATVQASNATNEPKGKRPYEMEWAGRVSDERSPTVGFEDLAGWTVESSDGVQASLGRSQGQMLFGQYTARLTYRGTSSEDWLAIRPPAPIPLPDDFDSVNVWIFGNNWEWSPDPLTPRVEVTLLLKDRSGRESFIPLTNVRWKEWWLVHEKLSPDRIRDLKGGTFSGIRVSNLSNKQDRSIWFDNLTFYRERLEPLTFKPRPRRGVDTFPGQSEGLNTGPGRLPFPTREQTILPMQFTSGWSNKIEPGPGSGYRFVYEGPDGDIEYAWDPSKGGPETITARIRGASIRPLGGASVTFETPQPPKFARAVLDGDSVRAEYTVGRQTIQWTARVWQKSLVLDCASRGGAATGLFLGQFEGAESPELILTPFLSFGGGSNPAILMARAPEGVYFGSVWADWYRSNASEMYADAAIRAEGAGVNGGLRYVAKTDGRRNDLFERIFVTVSPTFEETYPTVDNPKAQNAKLCGNYVWQETWGPHDYDTEMKRSRMLRSYGIENLIQCNHEITWRDEGESFTLRTRSAPGKGGDEALKRYVEHQRSLGWRSGLYTNYTDFAPVNEHWSPDYVQRQPDGDWRPAWPRNYALKPSRAVELDAVLAPQVQKKYGTNAAYTDVHTAVAPWGYNDYDARVPGAGTFAATFYAYGELLLNDQKVYGVAHSEGSYHWMYAGLATGNYGLCYPGIDPAKEPLNVAFDLYQIHSKEADVGVPWTAQFFRSVPGWDAPDRIDASIDQFLATTLAYGHMGWLVEEQHGIERTCRSYYMLPPVSSIYMAEQPLSLQYADSSGRLTSASEALADGHFSLSRLYVRYPGGLHLYANGSPLSWDISGPAGKIELPRWGWAAWTDDGSMYETSSIITGSRADYCRSSSYEYLDGRGVLKRAGTLAASGGVVRRGNEFIDIGPNKEIGFQESAGGGAIDAIDASGKKLSSAPVRTGQGGYLWFDTVPGARAYRFNAQLGVSLASVSAPLAASPGQSLDIRTGDSPAGSVTVPRSAKPGDHVWLETEKGRIDVDVVAPLTLRHDHPQTLDRGGLSIPLRAESNTGGEAPAVRVAASDGVSAAMTPAASRDGRARAILEVRPGTGAGSSASVTIEASSGGSTVERRFEFDVLREQPVAHNLLDDRLAWGWSTVSRDGDTVARDTASGATWYKTQLTSGGVQKWAIFSHPPYQGKTGAVYGETALISIGPDQTFHTFIGIKDGGAASDGVTFSVWAIPGSGAPVKLAEKHHAERRWVELSAPLQQFAGKRIALRLMADVGPAGSPTADWAAWGEPVVRSLDAFPVLRLR